MTDAEPSQDVTALEFPEFVEQLNEKLRQAGVSSAETAFGIGCSIGLLPIGLVILVLLIFDVVNIILAFTLLLLTVLAMTGVGMLAASTARVNTTRRVFLGEVEPVITGYLLQAGWTRQQFADQAESLLGPDAPLRGFLSASSLPGEKDLTTSGQNQPQDG
jgi:hypothetical protein